jgi:predicted nucleic acid-binding protein
MNNIIPIEDYSFSEADEFLIDTNIWLYLYGPQIPKDWKTRVYSKSLKNILAAKSKIWIDVLILSEFINRYSRIEFEASITSGATVNFKNFRKSTAFVPIATAIANAVKRIIKQSLRSSSGFENLDINTLIQQFKSERPDFNDQVFVELCKSKKLKLITHDSDFKDCGITVLSANKKLLSK